MKKKHDIPSKLYYSISEVAKMTGVKAHVLRYWESEFPTFRPKKTRAGARRYRQKDIDEVISIKQLLYDEGFKIAGARKQLREMHKAGGEAAAGDAPQMALTFDGLSDPERLARVLDELRDVLELVKGLQAKPPKLKERKGKG